MTDFPFERSSTVFAAGALLQVRVYGVVKHFGIATGYGTVIHTSARFGRVEETDVAAFSGGRPITQIHYAHNHSGTELVARARSKKGMRYNVLINNCEHFVNWVLTGKGRSRQLGPVDPRQLKRD
ncbi:lecithin retinol acyltransferase family protein [Fretibacter rubidus]|uniref:lecithin retinol acyltransferase family protein n=1 Tax=Fretibacter rubidus TaxID=570162 RepID=UPI00352ACDB4